jgi:hypothetical protein
MTELDLEIPGLAEEIIAEFGKDITYTLTEPGDYNPATSLAEATGEPFIIKGIVEPYRGQRMLAGLIEVGDLKVTVAAKSFEGKSEPTPGDIADINGDGTNFNIITVLPNYSGELVAIYELQVRQG